MKTQAHLLDDGAHEVVDERPLRPQVQAPELVEIASTKPGGRMQRMQAAGDRHRREFILIRTKADVVKLSLPHVPVFRALVRAWTAKRGAGAADPGVSLVEIAQEMGVDPVSIKTPVQSLIRNRAIRSKTTSVGYQGMRSIFYPSDLGAQAIAIAEVLGEGSFVQVGRPVNAWRGRNASEPSTVFQFANLIKRGIAQEA